MENKTIIILALLFSCSKKPIESINKDNAFAYNQNFSITMEVDIDSVVSGDGYNSDSLYKGVKKRVVYKKSDPMKGVYQHKYICSSKSCSLPLSIYSDDTLSHTVSVRLQKYSEAKNINCRVNNVPCWCIFE